MKRSKSFLGILLSAIFLCFSLAAFAVDAPSKVVTWSDGAVYTLHAEGKAQSVTQSDLISAMSAAYSLSETCSCAVTIKSTDIKVITYRTALADLKRITRIDKQKPENINNTAKSYSVAANDSSYSDVKRQ